MSTTENTVEYRVNLNHTAFTTDGFLFEPIVNGKASRVLAASYIRGNTISRIETYVSQNLQRMMLQHLCGQLTKEAMLEQAQSFCSAMKQVTDKITLVLNEIREKQSESDRVQGDVPGSIYSVRRLGQALKRLEGCYSLFNLAWTTRPNLGYLVTERVDELAVEIKLQDDYRVSLEVTANLYTDVDGREPDERRSSATQTAYLDSLLLRARYQGHFMDTGMFTLLKSRLGLLNNDAVNGYVAQTTSLKKPFFDAE